jgi:hypothetical protein
MQSVNGNEVGLFGMEKWFVRSAKDQQPVNNTCDKCSTISLIVTLK